MQSLCSDLSIARASISFAAQGKKKKGNRRGRGKTQAHRYCFFHVFTSCQFLLENGRGGTVYSISQISVHLLFLRTWQILSLHNIPSTYNAKHFMTLLALGEEKMKHEIRNILAEQYSLTLVSLYTTALGKY